MTPSPFLRLLLRLYHPAFRARHGEEMLRVLAEQDRDATRRGRRIRFRVAAAWDALRNGLGTRWEAWRDGEDWTAPGGPGPSLDHGINQGSGGGMDGWIKDLRYAARSLLRTPGLTAVAGLTLALGIGANTAIFSVVRAVLLEPLPYEEPQELVLLWGEMTNRGVTHFPFAPPDFQDFDEGSERVEEMAGVFSFQQPLTGQGDPVQVDVGAVTWDFFHLLGVDPALGRGFVAEDDLPVPQGTPPADQPPATVLLSHALWQQRFGGDPGVVGGALELAGQPGRIIGVMPAGFELLLPPTAQVARAPDLWVTARVDFANAPRNNVFLKVVGRLAPDATVEQAQAETSRIADELRTLTEVRQTAGWRVRVEPLQADLTAHVRPVLLSLFGAVFFVLLIACANVANLLLVRATAREQELAVRAALGGSRGRLLRQLLLECGLLVAGGALLGLMVAALGVDLLLALQPADLPRAGSVAMDLPVLGFTLLAAVVVVAVAGLAPALRASRVDLSDALKDRGRAGIAGRHGGLRNALVVGEVALCLVLLVGAGLMTRSFVELTRVEPGYDPESVLAFQVNLPFGRYPDPRERSAVTDALQERLEAIPGVTSASAAFPLPLDESAFNGRYGPAEALQDPEAFGQAAYRVVLPGYFETMGTRLLSGRTFNDADAQDSAAVVVVDELLAEALWPGGSAVGERFLVRVITPEPEWVEVIGVVEHQRAESLAEPGMETVYFTDRYAGSFANSWVVRTQGDPGTAVGEVRAALATVDPSLPMADVRAFERTVRDAMGGTRFALTLIAIFGALALLLAAVGLYGVLSFVVRQRRAEIGVRLAFGAGSGRILGMVVRQGMTLALVGVVVGLIAAVPLSGLLESLLVGVPPRDPLTFTVIGVLFVAVAALASWLPAWRATRVDPVTALREE